MNIIRLPDFTNVVANGTAILRVPKWSLTLCRLVLRIGGGVMTKALISEIRVKIGSRVVWTSPTGAGVAGGTLLDKINKYRGIYDEANHLTIDFTERDFLTNIAREIGGVDMSKLPDEVYVEVVIGAATTPTLYAYGLFTPPQGESEDPTQAIQKLVAVPFAFAAAGKVTLPFEPRGSIIKRAYIAYAGTDWGATADGNLAKIEVKKNGLTILGEVGCYDLRFMQSEYRKTPQAKMLVIDFTFDNNLSGALKTADAASLEILPTFTAPDSGVALFEVLDAPYNL